MLQKNKFIKILLFFILMQTHLFYASSHKETPKQPHEIVLEIIQELAPELHAKIIALDPNGSKHFELTSSIVSSIASDGLPTFEVNITFMQLPKNQQKAIIAHELSHYILEHNITNSKNHDEIKNYITKSFKEKKETSSKLYPEIALENAYIRTCEYEADRFATMNLKVPPQDLIDLLNSIRLEEDVLIYATKSARYIGSALGFQYKPNPNVQILNTDKTLSRTHPITDDRIQQLRNIQKELDLPQTAYSHQPTSINWDQIQYDGLKYNNSSRRLIKAVKKYLPNMLTQAQADMQINFMHSDNTPITQKNNIISELEPLSSEKLTQKNTVQSEQKYSLNFDKPLLQSPFAIKTKIANPYNQISDRIKTLPANMINQQIPDSVKMNQQKQSLQQSNNHESEHLVALD